ncbi:MAG: flagellar FlbD family protein [Kiritimatiellae bacterium]|nr:flagellar FlbD family protein [Kiritimatiellia bacterium]MDD4734798.1 flagellar FlbD family protein [Kiritimatiellia bacterium]
MIQVTDLHGHSVYVNAELIEVIEENPDTQILMTTGKRLYVKENAETLAERVLHYKQQCMSRSELRAERTESSG